MAINPNKAGFIQAGLIILVLSAFFITIGLTENPSDYLPEKIDRPDRKGMTTGYVFLDWEELMTSGVEDSYLDLIARCLDYCLVHIQWNVVCRNSSLVPEPQRSSVDYFNNTLVNQNYLGNLSNFIRGLRTRGVKVIIHIWASSYTPNWMYPYTPELVGQKDRWSGIPADTSDPISLEHRNALKWSMIHFQEMLCQYLLDQGLKDDVMGFCLDDETTTANWNDFFAALTDTIHQYDPAWETCAMFNRYKAYHYTAESGMDVNGMDVYKHDPDFIQNLHYAWNHAGTPKLLVILDAMNKADAMPENYRLRRLAWVAWFMGADSIGWYSFLSGNPDFSCAEVRFQDSLPPGENIKTFYVVQASEEVHWLNQAWERIQAVGRSSSEGKSLESTLLRAYDKAQTSEFSEARALLLEVLEK